MSSRWEYKVVAYYRAGTGAHPGVLAELDRLGDEGWELVAAMPSGTSSGNGDLVLKRRREA